MPKFDLHTTEVIMIKDRTLQAIIEDFLEIDRDSLELVALCEWDGDSTQTTSANANSVTQDDEREIAKFAEDPFGAAYCPLFALLSVMARADWIPNGIYVIKVD